MCGDLGFRIRENGMEYSTGPGIIYEGFQNSGGLDMHNVGWKTQPLTEIQASPSLWDHVLCRLQVKSSLLRGNIYESD